MLVTARGRELERRVGRTACHRLVHFQADASPNGTTLGDDIEPGALVRVRIERALPHSLVGELLEVVEPSRVAPAQARRGRSRRTLVEPQSERYHRLGAAALEGAE